MAYNFTAASGQYLQAPYDAALKNNNFTLAAWVYPTTANVVRYIIAQKVVTADGDAGANYDLVLLADNTARARLHPNAVAAASSSGTVPTNAWSHVCATYSGSSLRIYRNGADEGNTSFSSPWGNNNNPLTIGRNPQTSAANRAPFDGNLAEVGIWSAALTAAEIASLAKGMTCDKIRPQSLVFYAPLVRDLQDLSGGLTITNNNTATVATHPRVYA
jgi:hypothetical protein